MRLAGEVFQSGESYPMVASSYDDRLRHRREAEILYKAIIKGELGDPRDYEDTLKRLQDQISGVDLRGV